MKIRTRLWIGVAMLMLVLAAAGVVIALTFQQVRRAARERDAAHSVVEGLFELNILTHDFAMRPGERARVQWSSKHAAIAAILEGLDPRSPSCRADIEKMRGDHKSIRELFARLAADEAGGTGREGKTHERSRETLVTQLLMRSHEMVGAASRLSRHSEEELAGIWQRFSWAMMASLMTIAVVMAGVSFWVNRSLVRPVSQLRKGTDIVGTGNLDFRVGTDARDEIGELSRAFDRMTANLRAATASRVELEQEVTERKRAEGEIKHYAAQLEAANEELEAFSYSVSHDLRGPLRRMDGFSRMLLEKHTDELDEQGRHYLDRVRAGSQQMGELIDDLLKLSRITRSEMTRGPLDLSAIAPRIADELRQTQPGRDVEFVLQKGITVEGDGQLLRVVMENLLGNAWKFTGKQDKARIEFGTEEREGQKVCFVRDNGAGFDMAYAEKLFGAFQRLHRVDEFEGTGIGLATVQRIIHRHGGRVWAEGAIGKGATFYFTLGA